MYNKTELTAKAHVELMEIAEKMGISKAKRMDAQELIYKILDHQAANPVPGDEPPARPDSEKQQHKRQRLKPKLMAESSLKNLEVHRPAHRKSDGEQQRMPNLFNKKNEMEDFSALNLQISSLEMPKVPEVPEMVIPSGRPTFKPSEDEAAPRPEEVRETPVSPAESAPAATVETPQEPVKKKRGRPRKNPLP